MLFPLLLLVPAMAIVLAVYIYQHVGKREFLQFDLVQFTYSFIILPVVFVWLKSFLFFFLTREIEVNLSTGMIFTIDTVLSLVFLYIFAFVVIHSLTKTFNLKHYREPLYDIFEHSEYYHVWLSHVAMYGGMIGFISLLSVLNVFLPMQMELGKLTFYSWLAAGFAGGLFGFAGIWLSDPEQSEFMRLMKLVIGGFWLLHAVLYIVFDPQFNATRLVYWVVFGALSAMTLMSFFLHRSDKAVRFIERFKHDLWEKKLFVLEPDKKKSSKKT